MFPSWKITAWGVFGFFGYHFCLFYSFRYAPAVEVNLINYLWPVILVLITPFAFPQRHLKNYHYVGAFFAFCGFLLMVGKGTDEIANNSFKGHLLAFTAALIWPIYSIGKLKMPTAPIWSIGGFCFITGLLCLGVHLYLGPKVSLTEEEIIILICMGLGPFGIAFYTWDLALKLGDVRVVGALSYLTPVLSTFGLVIFADQVIDQVTFWALVLIILGAGSSVLDFFKITR